MVKELFGQGAEFMSIFGIALTVGVGLGALVFPMLNQKIKVRPLVVMSGIAVGAGVFLMTLGPLVQEVYWEIFLLVVIASFLIGAGSGVLSSALNVQLMKKVEPDYLARTVAIFGAGGSAAECVRPTAAFQSCAGQSQRQSPPAYRGLPQIRSRCHRRP